MKRTIALALWLSFTMPASAGLLDSLLGTSAPPAIECAPRDGACILDALVEAETERFENLNDYSKEDISVGGADRLAAWMSELNPEAFERLRKRYRDAGAGSRFFEALDRALAKRAPIATEALVEALETRRSPDARPLGEYVRDGFRQLLDRDPERGVALFNEHLRWMWKNAAGAFDDVHSWLARNDVAEFERYSARFRMLVSGPYDGWEVVSSIAAEHCQVGSTDEGRRVLATLEERARRFKPDEERKAMRRAKIIPGTIACRGVAAAMERMEPIPDLMQREMEWWAAKPDEPERAKRFVLGVIRSEVAENMIAPITHALLDEGRTAEARKVFERLPSGPTVIGAGELASEGMLAMEFPEDTFETFLRQRDEDGFYGPDSLGWFLARDDDSVAPQGMSLKDRLERVLDAVEQEWSSPKAVRAARKLYGLIPRAEAQYDWNKGATRDLLLARLARLEVLRGCSMPDPVIERALEAAPGYTYRAPRVAVLAALVNLANAERSSGTPADCLPLG